MSDVDLAKVRGVLEDVNNFLHGTAPIPTGRVKERVRDALALLPREEDWCDRVAARWYSGDEPDSSARTRLAAIIREEAAKDGDGIPWEDRINAAVGRAVRAERERILMELKRNDWCDERLHRIVRGET